MNQPCRECGGTQNHKLDCTLAKEELKRYKRPPVKNYSSEAQTNRGPKTMKGTVVPLLPVIEECPRCGDTFPPEEENPRRHTSMLPNH